MESRQSGSALGLNRIAQHSSANGGSSQRVASLDQAESLGSSFGADNHLQAIKDSFKQAANSLTEFYKQSSHTYNVAYSQGKTDAYDEVFAWLLTQS